MAYSTLLGRCLGGLLLPLLWQPATAQSPAPPEAGAAVTEAGVAGVAVSDAGRRAQAPSVAVGSDGSIHVVWLDKGTIGTADKLGAHAPGGHSHQSWSDVFYAHSSDGGKTFSRPRRVNAQDGEVWGFSVSKPSIGISRRGTLHIAYPANEISATNGKPVAVMHYVRSTDGGRSFSTPLRLNTNPPEDLSAAVHGGLAQAQAFATLAVGPEGDVYAAWLDTRVMIHQTRASSTYLRVSRDDGQTWEPEREAFGADACPCCQLTSTIGSAGELHVASRLVHEDNHREPTVTVSRDGARTFSPRVGVGGPAWVLDGCPLKPTAIAAAGALVHTAVFNGAVQPSGVLYSRSAEGGRSFGEGVKLHPEATVSDAPALAASGDHAFAFWHAKVGAGERRVYGRLLTAGGAHLGPVFAVGAGRGASSLPAAATLEGGGAVVVWQQGEQVMSARLPPPASPASSTASVAPAAVTPIAPLTAEGFSSLLARQRGQFVVLNLWATWCVPCLKEIPDLVTLSREFAPRGVRLVAVAMDEPTDLARVEEFRQRVFPDFSSWLRAEPEMDTLVSRIDPAWNELLPTTYLIGRDGQVLKRLQGKKSLEDFRGEIVALL
ncbi:MAG: redoxin domain-containing protein [Gammaproteobacteria bacterium]